jgi:HD-GYP domain-containing protein (c-di-GMP phosphodiesterase class II)
MTLRPRRLVLLFGLIPTLVTAVLSLARPSFLTSLEYSTYDTLLRSAETRPTSAKIAIVDIDDRSLLTIGQWPWRRDVIGRLVARLRDLGASTVALDIMFSESDRQEAPSAVTDAALAGALRAGRVVLGYALTFDSGPTRPSACVQHPIGLPIIQSGEEFSEGPFFRATGAICNLEVLTRAANASGFLNAAPDPDGLLRRAPLLLEFDGRIFPGLALATVIATTGTRDIALRVANVNTSSLVLDNRTVPLDGKSNLLLRYRGGKRTFPYVSAADVLAGRAQPGFFKGKIVFVGTTALGTREVVSTPLDTQFAGVEVQATVADNLLQQDFIRRPEHGITLEMQVVLALGIISALLVGRFGLASGAFGVALCLAALWGGSLWLLSRSGIFLSPLFPTIGLISALAAMTVARFTIERGLAEKAGEEKVTSQRLMVQALLSLTEVRDAETGRHSRRTQQYARVLAEQLATHPQFKDYLTPERIELLASLAPLHDIGKVGVPDRLLNKPGQLTPEELVEMRKHPEHGRDVILHAQRDVGVRDDAILEMAKDIVYTHHEKWDGSGYPQGLSGTAIPIAGRLMAIVDVYDACLTRRLYRPPLSADDAVALIAKGRGTHFDPDVVDAFVKVATVFRSLSSVDGDH